MPKNNTPPQANTYFHTLDGLRGLAAIAVALFHWLLNFAGFLAVDFFLVLSGFILAHRYLYTANTITGGQFVLARLARLYPMHLYGLLSYALVYTCLAGALPHYPDGTAFTFLQQLTLTHNIGLNTQSMSWNMPSWSISVEFWLNLVFFCCISRHSKSLTLLLGSVAGLVIIGSQTGHLDTNFQNYFHIINSGLLRGWSSFALGILAYRTYCHAVHINWPTWLLMAAEIFIAVIVLGLFFARGGTLRSLDMLAPFVFAILVVIFALEKGWISRTVAKLQWLGNISYSLYLNHLIILMLINKVFTAPEHSHAELTALYLGTLLIYSALTYQYIELPGKRMILRLRQYASASSTPEKFEPKTGA